MIKAEKSEWMMLPPQPYMCQECAYKHDPEAPHNAETLYYKVQFHNNYSRWPTWLDAMEHCTDDVKRQWIEALTELGVDVNSTLTGKTNKDG